jgi:hypothetical protein
MGAIRQLNAAGFAPEGILGTPGPDNPGVIGRLLKEDERTDLIEYLKTL